MSTRWLIEADVDLLIDEIKAKIGPALAGVRTQRGDASVTTEPPVSYFTYPKAKGYRTPAIFVFGQSMDFRQSEKQGNFVTALSTIQVTALVEEKDAERLTTKCYRYAAALHEILDQTTLQSGDGEVRLVSRVSRFENSDLFTNTDDVGRTDAVFRKEVALFLDVEHFENF